MVLDSRKGILECVLGKGPGKLKFRAQRVERLGETVGLLVDTRTEAMM
jgi:hypothetical protein